MSETVEEQRAKALAELERLDREAAEAAQRDRQQQLEVQRGSLPPELQAQAAELEAQAKELLDQEFAPPWKPTKAELGHPLELVGQVNRIDPNVGPSPAYGTYSAVMEVTTTAGERWAVWAQHGGVIFQQLRRLKVQPGDVIGLRYLGKKKSETSGFDYQNYRVVKIGEQGPGDIVDWAAPLTATAEPAQLPAANGSVQDDDIPF